jgi:segregation and condensation protein B
MPGVFNLKNIVEAALLAAGRPLSLDALQSLFTEIECPEKQDLRAVLQALADDYRDRGIEIVEVSSGWRIQVGQGCSPWVSRLWDERPARYSRALMETLALIAYRQPITRGEIEDIRGVSVSTNIVKTLLEREWIRVVGQRDVPGKPSLYGTTREFLDYFGLKSLDELPTLAELRDLDEINRELDLSDPDRPDAAQRQDGDGKAMADDQVEDAEESEFSGDATGPERSRGMAVPADAPGEAIDDPGSDHAAGRSGSEPSLSPGEGPGVGSDVSDMAGDMGDRPAEPLGVRIQVADEPVSGNGDMTTDSDDNDHRSPEQA